MAAPAAQANGGGQAGIFDMSSSVAKTMKDTSNTVSSTFWPGGKVTSGE